MLKQLGHTMMGLNSIDTQWGIWAEAPFTEESPSRVGQQCFENGGLLDEFSYVGNLSELSPYFSPAMICCRWGTVENDIQKTSGTDEICVLGSYESPESETPEALFRQHIAPLIVDFREDFPHGKLLCTPEAFGEWLEEARHKDYTEWPLPLISESDNGGVGYVELYIEENHGTDEAAHKEIQVEELILWAEERRQDLENTGW